MKRADSRFPRWLIVWGPAVAWAAVLFLLSELRGVPLNAALPTNDKLVHVALYTILGMTLRWAWFASRSERWPGLSIPHVVAIGVGLAYGAIDEVHQYFVPRRMPSVADWVADVVGVFVGYAVASLLLRALGRRQES